MRRTLIVFTVLVLGTGCSENRGGVSPGGDVSALDDVGGADVGDGEVSDIDAEVRGDGASDSEVDEDTGPPPEVWESLAFALPSDVADAGESVGYTAVLVSESGAEMDVAVTIVSDIEIALDQTEAEITPTVAGTHALAATATYEGVDYTDTATLVVAAAEPSAISMMVSDDTPERDQWVYVSVAVVDRFGNSSDAPWTLTVDGSDATPEDGVTVDGARFSCAHDGSYTAVGTVDGTEISDAVGPIVVDGSAPELDIFEPARGTFSGTYTGTVAGTAIDAWSAVESVTVDGVAVELDEDGGFSRDVAYEPGINVLQTIARDVRSNSVDDIRAVLAADVYLADGAAISGLVIRANEQGMTAMEAAVEDLASGISLDGLVPETVYSDRAQTCPLGVCVTWYALTVTASNPRFSSIDVQLEPSDGRLAVTTTVRGVAVDWRATGVIAQIPTPAATGTMRATTVTVSMNVSPIARSGRVDAIITDVSVSSTGLTFGWNSWIADAAAFFGIDIDALFRKQVEDAIRDAIVDAVPDALESIFELLAVEEHFTVRGVNYTLVGVPERVLVDMQGMSLLLTTSITPSVWRAGGPDPGSPYMAYSPPIMPASPGWISAASLDFVNQALFAYWGGGLLERAINLGLLDLDPSVSELPLDALFVTVSAELPPVVVPSADPAVGELQVADVRITVRRDGLELPGPPIVDAYIGLHADVALSLTDQSMMTATFTDIATWVDMIEPVGPDYDDALADAVVDALSTAIVRWITNGISKLPVPMIAGYGLDDPAVSAAGADRGYILFAGDLTVR